MDNSVLERSPSDQRLTMSVRVSLMPLCWGLKATVSKPLRILFSLPFLPRFHLFLYIYIFFKRSCSFLFLSLSLSLLVFYFLLLRETFQRRTHPLKCALGHLKRIPQNYDASLLYPRGFSPARQRCRALSYSVNFTDLADKAINPHGRDMQQR